MVRAALVFFGISLLAQGAEPKIDIEFRPGKATRGCWVEVLVVGRHGGQLDVTKRVDLKGDCGSGFKLALSSLRIREATDALFVRGNRVSDIEILLSATIADNSPNETFVEDRTLGSLNLSELLKGEGVKESVDINGDIPAHGVFPGGPYQIEGQLIGNLTGKSTDFVDSSAAKAAVTTSLATLPGLLSKIKKKEGNFEQNYLITYKYLSLISENAPGIEAFDPNPVITEARKGIFHLQKIQEERKKWFNHGNVIAEIEKIEACLRAIEAELPR